MHRYQGSLAVVLAWLFVGLASSASVQQLVEPYEPDPNLWDQKRWEHLNPRSPASGDQCRKSIRAELDYLATIPRRRTGSPEHNEFINHIQKQLEKLGLKVHSDTWHFEYYKPPATPPKLTISGHDINISSIVPYSGITGSKGVTGPLISLMGPDQPPDWQQASGGIAVVNLTNPNQNRQTLVPLWPGSPEWGAGYVSLPASVANNYVVNLTDAANAGVKGIVYVWENATKRLLQGQYGPFWTGYQDIAAVYASPVENKRVLKAISNKESATITLTGSLVPHTPTRNLWVIFRGTEKPHESMIINTHTDGTNIGEEDGPVALLAYARSLIANPPKRTTILAFITGHIHSAPFSYATHRATTAWLADNPTLWKGSAADGGFKAVFGSCVEHLGMRAFIEDLDAGTYKLTDKPAAEVLYAATSQLANVTFDEWRGAVPNVTRVCNPIINGTASQGGEGLPYLLVGIPEISLVTAPSWLLKEFVEGYNQSKLIDCAVVERQVASFERIWRRVDGMPARDLGTVPIS